MANAIQLSEDTDLSVLLQSYIQSGGINFLIGSGASVPAIQTAGNIEKEIDQLLSKGDQAGANLKALDFVEDLAAKHALVSAGKESADISTTMSAYSDFVAAVDRILFERKNLLLPRQANVFTTNYDMFIEHAANKVPSLILNDGFIRTPDIRPEFPFAPERYSDRTYRSGPVYNHPSEVPTINLIKLHGSLSWRSSSDSIVYDTKSVLPLEKGDRTDDAKVSTQLEKYFLILPNLRKFHAAMMDRIYYDLLRIFANSMDRENAVLICFGFSFEDEHILDITRRALRNPTSQLLVFSYSHDSVESFKTKFAMQRNATIIFPMQDEKIDFSRLNSLLLSALPG